MESVNFIKGYGKLNPSDENPINSPPTHHHHHHRRRRRIILVVSAAVLLTLLIAALIAALIYDSATESEESEPSQLAPSDSLKTICAVTRFPDSCLSSISPLNSPPSTTPLAFFNLSLHASLIQVSNLKSLLTQPNSDPAMKDCADLFDDAASQLSKSTELICVKSEEKVLTEMRISDLQSWISAAMTDQETCVDGVEETGSTAAAVVGELKKKVRKSQEYMSNTLAILNNIQSLEKKFGVNMH